MLWTEVPKKFSNNFWKNLVKLDIEKLNSHSFVNVSVYTTYSHYKEKKRIENHYTKSEKNSVLKNHTQRI